MIKVKQPQPGELVPCCEICLGTHRYEDNDGLLVCSTCIPWCHTCLALRCCDNTNGRAILRRLGNEKP